MSEGDLLKDQRGSPAYISPDVLSGRCSVQGSGPGHLTARPCGLSFIQQTLSFGHATLNVTDLI